MDIFKIICVKYHQLELLSRSKTVKRIVSKKLFVKWQIRRCSSLTERGPGLMNKHDQSII